MKLEASAPLVQELIADAGAIASPCAAPAQSCESIGPYPVEVREKPAGGALSTQDLCDLWTWNATVPEASEIPVHLLICETARLQPKKIAICAWDGEWTYEELDSFSTQFAYDLVRLDVTRQTLPLCLPKSKWMPVAMLAAMKAGAASVLLDRNQPEERLRAVVDEACPPVMICSADSTELASRLFSGPAIVVDRPSSPARGEMLPIVLPSDPLYLIFTSGTTGKPKGVIITHGNFSSAVKHQGPRMYTLETRLLDSTSYAFDVAWSNFIFALTGGACLCVPSEEERMNDLAGCITKYSISNLDLTPSTLRLIPHSILRGVQSANVGGEQLFARDIHDWQPIISLQNMYGPSECTPTTILTKIEATTTDGSIGKAAGVCTWVVDARGDLAPIGCVGELLLEGPLVGPGYLDKELSCAAYVEDPPWLLHGDPNHSGRRGRLYQTGDLVRYHTDGSLIFIGRKDLRVKINGQLVELSEIEHEIRSALPAIINVIVDFVSPQNHPNSLLIALLELDEASESLEVFSKMADRLNDRLAKKLPAYMIPSMCMPLEIFPVTVAGKIDRKALRALVERQTYTQLLSHGRPSEGCQASTSAAEQQMKRLWASVLQTNAKSISLEDSFLRIGGDSLGAMQLVAAARDCGLSFSVADVMQHPRLKDLTELAGSAENLSQDHVATPFSLLKDPSDTDSIRKQVAFLCNVSHAQVQDCFPCTSLQEGLLALTALQKGDYISRTVFELQAGVDLGQFKEAWATVVARTPTLRSRIVDMPRQGLVQVVLDEQVNWILRNETNSEAEDVGKEQLSLTGFHKKEQETHLGRPMVRFEMAMKPDGRRFFTWVIHHSLFDGQSIPLILQDVHRAFAGEELEEGPAFQGFVKHFLCIDSVQATSFWYRQLRELEAPGFPALPLSDCRPQVRESLSRHIVDLHWPQMDVTASNVIRAAYALVVSHYSNSPDIVFGAISTGRQAAVPGVESMRGPTIATMPIRVRLNYETTVEAFLRQVQTQATEMTAFEQVGLQRIRRISNDANRACQFRSLLVVQPRSWLPDVEGGVLFRKTQENANEDEDGIAAPSTYAMTVTCLLGKDSVDIRIDFDPAVLKSTQIVRIERHMEHMLRQLCAAHNTKQPLSALEAVTEGDLSDIWKWNANVPAPYPGLVHEWIGETVRAQPESIAVNAWDGSWTYHELDAVSTKLGYYLLSFKIDYRNKLVPLYIAKSKWMPVAMLAVMKTGGASVALDVSQPTERLRSILHRVEPTIVLTMPMHFETVGDLVQCPIVIVSDDKTSEIEQAEIKLPSIDPASILYCVFTSGSTGLPKGVLVSHANFSSAVVHQQIWYGYGPTSRVYDFASYAFDAAWLNVLATLCCGGCLCIPNDADRINRLVDSMQQFHATHVDLTPSVARLLPLQILQQLRVLIVSGETLQLADARRWSQSVDLKNVYGPCECTPTATIASIQTDGHYEGSVIGKGVGVCTWIVNEGKLVPIGGIGELLLEGPLVGMGYLRDEERSGTSFINDPQWLAQGAASHLGRRGRLYRTGDLVRYTEDGDLIFIGRGDMRVKINGQLVELAEVEQHIQRYEHVRQCACLVPERGRHAKRLVGVFVLQGAPYEELDGTTIEPLPFSENSKVSQHTDAICQILGETLPLYMIPTMWVAVKDIPLNPAGKLDRTKLLAWLCSLNDISYNDDHGGPDAAPLYSAGQQSVKHVLLDACSRVLDISSARLECHKSFINNGGDSISAMRLVSRCRAANLVITVASVLQNRSLTSLAETLCMGSTNTMDQTDYFDTPFLLSPIQQWFFSQLQPDQVKAPENRYNQSFCLRLQRRVDATDVARVVNNVVASHSMLRAQFLLKGGTWMQQIPSFGNNCKLFQSVQRKDIVDVITLVEKRHRQIDITEGPVFLADLIELSEGSQYLVLIAHHLVVDLVSWQIIIDDFETALCGGSLQPCLPFQKWNEMQIERVGAMGKSSPEEWLSTEGAYVDLDFWKFTSFTSNVSKDHETQVIEVDTETTRMLLSDANKALRTEPVDLILSAIWASFFEVFMERQHLTIWNEGHGREPWASQIDLSRTVGWFTTISPIHISRTKASDFSRLARLVKDARKSLSANGWTYFTSRYLSQPGADICKPHGPPVEIEFNYHGQSTQLEQEKSLFDRVDLANIIDEGPNVPAPHLIGIEAYLEDKRLYLSISWNRHIAHQSRILTWINRIAASTSELSCDLVSRQPSNTLCDYPFLDLTYENLDELQHVLLPRIEAVNDSQVVEVLPCSPMVTGILLSQSKQPHLYKTSEMYELTMTEDTLPSVDHLATAWQKVIAHQPSLRSVLTPGLDHKAAFYQVILQSARGDIVKLDCENEHTAIHQLAALPLLDCHQLKPPHRLTLCRLRTDQSRIICQIEISHTVTDGTSSNLLTENWSRAYEGHLVPLDLLTTCREVTRIISTSAAETLSYWQQKMLGAHQCYFPRLGPNSMGDEPCGDVYVKLLLPNTLIPGLQQLCSTLSVTLTSVYQAAWALTLASYCGTDNVCFGYLTSGRSLAVDKLDSCVGAFANMLVCRVDHAQHMSYRELIRTVCEQMVQDLTFEHCYLAAIQHGLKLPSNQSLFNCSLNCQRVDSYIPQSQGRHRLSFETIDGEDPTEHDVAARVNISENHIELGLETRASFMSQMQAERVLSLYSSTIAAFTDTKLA
ncbi:MAG: NRPS [Chrysothrix sp. TS-e1954]|nr:MAG: NRPS [Chrysothrix sp. TS-e1954]